MVCTRGDEKGGNNINGQRFLLCISIIPPFEIENFQGGGRSSLTEKDT